MAGTTYFFVIHMVYYEYTTSNYLYKDTKIRKLRGMSAQKGSDKKR